MGSGFSGDGGEIPPSFRNASRSGDEGDSFKSRADQADADILWGFYNIDPHNFPGLNEILEKYEIQPLIGYQVSEKGLKKFLKRAKEAGLIKHPRGFSLRQHLRSLVHY